MNFYLVILIGTLWNTVLGALLGVSGANTKVGAVALTGNSLLVIFYAIEMASLQVNS